MKGYDFVPHVRKIISFSRNETKIIRLYYCDKYAVFVIKIASKAYVLYICQDGYYIKKSKINTIIVTGSRYGAIPLIICDKMRGKEMKVGTIAHNEDLLCMNIDTFLNYSFFSICPKVFISKGGNIVRLNSQLTKRIILHEEKTLSNIFNVTNATLQKYMTTDPMYISEERYLHIKKTHSLDLAQDIDIYLLSIMMFKHPTIRKDSIDIDLKLFNLLN